MKKAISIAVLTALISGVFMLFGCSGGLVSGTYSDESEYFVGDGLVLQAVDSLEINWINGKVNVCYGLAREAIITESATRELSQSEVLRYGVFDGKLKVQFASSGHKFESGVVKNLTVVIPFEIKLKSLVINGVSAEINVDKIHAQTVNVSSVSGNVSYTHDNTSCDLSQSIKVSCVSGNLLLDLNCSVQSLKATSVSGTMQINCKKVPQNSVIESVSGNIKLNAGENLNLSVEFETVSGALNSLIPFTKTQNVYRFGLGENTAKINTVSGNLSVA